MWAPPSSGQMRYSIQFMRRADMPDGKGNTLESWAPLCGPYRARLRPINGREEVLVGKLSGVQPFELLLRVNSETSGVTPEDLAVNYRTGQHYDITAIQNPDERNMWLSMLVKAGTAEG